MQIGSMEILGTINVEGIKMGLSQMKNSLESSKVQAKSLFGDMERLGKSTASIGKTMAVASVGFLGGLIALASVGPQTNVAMERLKFELFRIGMALDKVLGPAFNSAVDYVGKFVDYLESDGQWILENFESALTSVGSAVVDFATYLGGDGKIWLELFGEIITGVCEGIIDFTSDIINAVEVMGNLAKDWSATLGIDLDIKAIGDIAKELTPIAIAGLIGRVLFGKQGMIVAASGMAGWKIGEFAGDIAAEETKKAGGWMAENAPKELSDINVGIWRMVEELTEWNISGNRPSN